jgi:hypothetical protein
VRTTIPAGGEHPHVPDLIGRDFPVGAPGCRWVGDITYILTGEGWLYLASVVDLGSRRYVGYSMADHMRTELVADALDMAITAHGGHVEGTVFHSVRGSQYLSGDFQTQVAQAGMRQSVGRTGQCWDNAAAEALWSSLTRELVNRYQFATRAEARRAIFAWINWYNQHRRHSTLGYLNPDEVRTAVHSNPPRPTSLITRVRPTGEGPLVKALPAFGSQRLAGADEVNVVTSASVGAAMPTSRCVRAQGIIGAAAQISRTGDSPMGWDWQAGFVGALTQRLGDPR